jgi:hypothetical protein
VFCACLEFLFVFFVSGGHWTNWPASTDFYDQQAEAFLHGQVSLLTSPDPRLAELSDPYSPAARKGIDVPLDISYYQGRYYLYWGPVPAVGIAMAHAGADALWEALRGQSRPARLIGFLRGAANLPMGDNIVVFITASGILLFATLILLRLRILFFPKLSSWLLFGSMAAVAMGSPLLWMLNRPLIYEAAITSGQMFLLAGLFIILPVFASTDRHPLRYACAALCWVLALGSRLSLAFAVLALVGAVVILQVRSPQPRGRVLGKLIWFGLPLLAGAFLLGAFNEIRFGGPFETGFRFQMGALDYTQSQADIFSFRYAFCNLYNYFLRPFVVQSVFPFLQPAGWNPLEYPFFLARPAIYYVEPVTGILLASPFLFGFLGLWFSRYCQRSIPSGTTIKEIAEITQWKTPPSLQFLWVTLLLSLLLAFLPLLVYWYCTERFLMDFAPIALILSAMGVWIVAEKIKSLGRWRRFVYGFFFVSMAWTILVNFLLSVTGYGNHW